MTTEPIHARQRLYVSGELGSNQQIELAPEQSHYLEHVMRLKPGTPVKLFNGTDGEWLGIISHLHKKKGSVEISQQLRPQKVEKGPILAFAPIKKQRMDFLIEKAVELGVGHLQPIITRHSITDKVRLDRIEAQIIEAAEQCERLTIPQISAPQKLFDWMNTAKSDTKILFCDETGSGEPIGQVLSQLLANRSGSAIDKDNVVNHALVIGPEGGFNPEELDQIKRHASAIPVSLGPRILRAETAAIAALSIYQDRLGDWSGQSMTKD